MLLEAHHLEPQPRPRKLSFEFLELLHHVAVDEPRARKIHDHVVTLDQAELLDLTTKRDPVGEYG